MPVPRNNIVHRPIFQVVVIDNQDAGIFANLDRFVLAIRGKDDT
jgi:hypothetical protein